LLHLFVSFSFHACSASPARDSPLRPSLRALAFLPQRLCARGWRSRALQCGPVRWCHACLALGGILPLHGSTRPFLGSGIALASRCILFRRKIQSSIILASCRRRRRYFSKLDPSSSSRAEGVPSPSLSTPTSTPSLFLAEHQTAPLTYPCSRPGRPIQGHSHMTRMRRR
jgi:hypothetical protein